MPKVSVIIPVNPILHFLHCEKNYQVVTNIWYNTVKMTVGREEPSVSVLMPSLNVGMYVRVCLESVVRQTLHDIEIICIDAGSTDGTAEILDEFAARDCRIRVLHSDRKSYGYQMNMGLAAARGEYVGIIETDDVASLNMFERMVTVARQNDLDVLKTDYRKFTGELSEDSATIVKCCGNPGLYGKVLSPVDEPQVVTFSLNQSSLFRRSFLERNGIRFNETPGASYQDVGFFLQTHFLARRILCLAEPFYWYRIDNPNSSINNQGKAYMVCGEIDFARAAIVARCKEWECLRTAFGREAYYAYRSTMRRISADLRYEFARRFSDDLKAAYFRGEIDRSRFGEKTWSEVLGMMLMPIAQVDLAFPPEFPQEERQLVVSLTSWPKRIELVYKVIDNMLRQTRRPDKVVLYLAADEFPDRKLPENLNIRLARDSRFEVRYVENLRSHKKYIEVFRDFPEANVVLVDDDIVYPESMLCDLLIQHRRMPHVVVAMRTHVISMTKRGAFARYLEWMSERKIVNSPSPMILATTGGGTLIPPGALPASAFDRAHIRSVALSADDLWLKWHLLMAGVPVVWINKYKAARLEVLPGSQSETLYDTNVSGGNNDRVWKALQELYPQDAERIRKLLFEEYIRLYPAKYLPHQSWLARKLRGLRLCFSENGWRYTLFHFFEKAFGALARLARVLSGQQVQAPRPRAVRPVSVSRRQESSADARPVIKVSVIVPVCNAEPYLAECLDSVLAQTIGSLEVICIDDGSTDGSQGVLCDYAARDDRVVVLAQKRSGASVARNKALQLARGEFVTFMDADDFYPDSNSLKVQYEAAVRSGVAASCGYFEKFSPETPDVIHRPKNYRYAAGIHRYADMPMDFGYTCFLFRRSMLLKNGIAFPLVSRYQDPPFFVRAMFAAERFVAVDVSAYRYRLGHQQIDWSANDCLKLRDTLKSMSDVVGFARAHGLARLVSMSKSRLMNDYCEIFLQQVPAICELPEFQALVSLFAAEDAREIANAYGYEIVNKTDTQKKGS